MTPDEKAATQARADKLLARIAELEELNRVNSEARTALEEKLKEKDRKILEQEAELCETTKQSVRKDETIDMATNQIADLHIHMAELEEILMRDNDAQTLLDALRHVRRVRSKS